MGDHGTKEDFFSCFVDDVYGLTKLAPQPRTILDIGANVGFFSLAARGIFPEAQIHAYEPNPRVLDALHANSLAGGFQFYPEAVGAAAGWVSMIDQSDSNQAQTSALGSADQGGIAQVDLATAIERLGGQVDLLKMDCEGAEWDIFKAVDAWHGVRELRMEYHLTNGRTVADVRHALNALSFDITRQIDQQGFGLVWATHTR
ncbi:FkbM family methyltransferase [Prosthecobacter sp.]|uniref:FkbM family methyltransferase n=1 Tax=Prosthecobacter sp. TaxID=1965333 RepID=UPI003784A7E5